MDIPVIWKSRKFWIMVVDLIVSVSGYFLAKYANPTSAQDALFLIGALQPVVIAVIASITVQNVEAMKVDAEVLKIESWRVEDKAIDDKLNKIAVGEPK